MTKRRKQCSEKGCRKGRAEGSEHCEEHPSSGGNGVGEGPAPEDDMLHLTRNELMEFNALRLKAENKLQAIRVLELEQDRADREYVAQKHTRSQMIEVHRRESEASSKEYLSFVEDLAKKYKLNPKHMGIDDETGVLRDLRPPTEEQGAPG